MDEKFFRNADFALENLVDRELPPLNFGGKPGEAVPAVDPDDLKAVWQIGRDVQAGHSGQQDAVAMMKHACKPEADMEAVSYRTLLAWMVNQIAPEQLAKFMREGQPDDSVFRAAAKVPVE